MLPYMRSVTAAARPSAVDQMQLYRLDLLEHRLVARYQTQHLLYQSQWFCPSCALPTVDPADWDPVPPEPANVTA